MSGRRYEYDQCVLVDFFGDGQEKAGEIDAIDFEGDPDHAYRVWYDEPRREPTWGKNDPIEIECEWVSPLQMRPADQEERKERS